ncbi:MAG: outer membrane lipoprotein-sorting protein [Spirochaetaceae bacterium]
MKKIYSTILLLLTMTLFGNQVDNIISEFADAIMIPNLYGVFTIELISSNGEKREIQAKAYQKQVSNNQMNRLFVFMSPPSVRDTGLLIHSFYDKGENKMWMYLPIVKKIKRISLSTAGGGYFMGSDFSYTDLISKSSNKYIQEMVGEAVIEGRECYTIKEYGNTKEQKEALGYEYIINYYGKKDSFLYGRDFYEFSGDLKKTYRVKEVKIFGKYIYPIKIEMVNQQTYHKSIITVDEISIDELSNKYFSTRYLKK